MKPPRPPKPPDGPDRFAEVRAHGVRRVAGLLGLEVAEPPRRGLRPCPVCGATQRSRSDRRPAAEITSDGGGFVCHACGAKGDALTLAAARLTGSPRPTREAWPRVLEELAGLGLCSPLPGRTSGPVARLAPPPRVTPPAPSRPDDAADLWARSRSVTDCATVRAALEARGLDPRAIADRDLARALPASGALPAWARVGGRSWRDSGHLCVLPLYDAAGELRSLHARRIAKGSPEPKGASPRGHEVRGLCFADAPARALLAGDAATAHAVAGGFGIVIAEGPPDFLAWGCRWAPERSDGWRAVLGVVAGSWSPELAARIPDGTTVAIRTHRDDAGRGYAIAIASSVADRCAVLAAGVTRGDA